MCTEQSDHDLVARVADLHADGPDTPAPWHLVLLLAARLAHPRREALDAVADAALAWDDVFRNTGIDPPTDHLDIVAWSQRHNAASKRLRSALAALREFDES